MIEAERVALRRRYAQERDKRLRPDGNAQYLRLSRPVRPLPEDPYTPLVEREPQTDHVTFAFIGGGFAGLVTGARLGRPGSRTCASSRRAATSAAPGTGTAIRARSATPPRWSTCRCWRRPATCRPRSTPTRRRSSSTASGSAGSSASTTTRCSTPRSPAWSGTRRAGAGSSAPTAATSSPPSSSGMGTGPLHVPKLPGIPGIETFRGHSFHTSRWDYDYTGGDPARARRWTGWPTSGWRSSAPARRPCSACRTWPRPAGELTSSSARPRRSTCAATGRSTRSGSPRSPRRAGSSAGWRTSPPTRAAAGCRTRTWSGRLDRPVPAHPRRGCMPPAAEPASPQTMWPASRTPTSRRWRRSAPGCDAIVARSGHGRAAQGVVSPAVQAALLPRRIPAGLQPARRAPGRHRRPGRRADHREGRRGAGGRVRGRLHHLRLRLRGRHRVRRRAGFDLVGRDGLKLSEAWAEGMRSKHGIHVHGFPNAFFVQPTQGANLISNVPHNLTEAGQTIAAIVRHAQDEGAARSRSPRRPRTPGWRCC